MTRRAQPVIDLLHKLNARQLGGFTLVPSQRLNLYSVGGRLLIVHEHGSNGREGYDVYVPIVDSNRVDETLQALEAYAKGDR